VPEVADEFDRHQRARNCCPREESRLWNIGVAAFRRESDFAVGNAVGSNVLNILGVLGPTALIQPLAITPSLLRFELPVMIGVSVLLFRSGAV
jgi:Ca2+/Na+ antiporter